MKELYIIASFLALATSAFAQNVLICKSGAEKTDFQLSNQPTMTIGDQIKVTDGVTTKNFDTDKRVTLYSKGSIKLNAQDEGNYYATFSNGHAVQFAGTTSVYAVDVNNGHLVVTEVEGKQVPANVGVMVKSSSPTATYNFVSSATSIDNNLLKPSGDEGITAANMDAANTMFYRLAMHNGTKIGFWWGAENGAAFNLAANKAYLAVPTGGEVKSSLWFAEDTEDAISTIEAESTDATFYNINGQRINKMQKGINIVNGKKYIVK